MARYLRVVNSGVLAMNTIFNDVCVLVATAFAVQPLVENAVHYGLHSSPRAGRIPDGSRTCFLRRAPAGPRSSVIAPATARIVRALVSVGGA